MEKRVVLFMVLSAAIMVAYVALQATFGPKIDPAAQQAADKGAKKDLPPKAADNKKPATDTPEAGEAPPSEAPAEEVDQTTAKPQWLSLGSVDPGSPYRMLVTFSSKGGAIERIEMSSPRYRDLEVASGYLGHLALTDSKRSKGPTINVVGAGTPAANAVAEKNSKVVGLQPGDIMLSLNDEPIKRASDFHNVIGKTKPDDKATIVVQRGEEKLTFTTTLLRRPLQVISPDVQAEGEQLTSKTNPLSGLLTLAGPRNVNATSGELAGDPLRNQHWDAKQSTYNKQPAVEFTYRLSTQQAKEIDLPGAVEVVRRYWLASTTAENAENPTAPAYHLNTEIEIRNLTDSKMELAYVLDGPNGLPTEGWWYSNKIGPRWTGAGARDVIWFRTGASGQNFRECSTIFKHAKANEEKPYESMLGTEGATKLDYVGVDAQYFSAIWLPDPKDNGYRTAVSMPATSIEDLEKVNLKRTNTTFRLTSDMKAVPANGSYKQSLRLFAGPKVPELLAEYGMYDVIEYGWFRVVSIPLAHLLHFLKNYVFFNYGLAIIGLTVIVRGCMVPFSLRAAKTAKMMQEMQPEIKAIKEKYKDDLQKQSEAQSALFKKYNYNPLSGCLPMFMQLPIFLGLYRALATDIELRQAALIPGLSWASNLAGPDKFWLWKDYLPDFLAGEASGWLGPYLNVLPLVSVALLLVHQKLFTPPATDEQTKMTQDMMKYMTVFMGVMFFKVPAGLCIYFITSSLWSICERMWLPKSTTPVAAGAADVVTESKPNAAKAKTVSAEERRKRLKQKKR